MNLQRKTTDPIRIDPILMESILAMNNILVKGDHRTHPAIANTVYMTLDAIFHVMRRGKVPGSEFLSIQTTRVNNITFYYDHTLKIDRKPVTFPAIVYLELDCVSIGQKWTVRVFV